LQSPIVIEQRVRDQKLPLGKPQGPMVWLREPSAGQLAASSNGPAVFVLNSGTP